jgi:GNAT superfamily N-acetyltransferase
VAIERAAEADFSPFLRLAGQVEELFGPMVGDQGFHGAVRRNISRGSAIVAREGSQVIGGLFLPHHRRPRYSISWLVVDEAARSRGIGSGMVGRTVISMQSTLSGLPH